MVEIYMAHSGVADQGVLPQPYETHVRNVISLTQSNTEKCLKLSTLNVEQKQFTRDITTLSAAYHDLGKLDDNTQEYLRKSDVPSNIKLINHVDAGVAFMLQKYKDTGNLVYLVSAFFILCHHFGLQNWSEFIEEVRGTGFFQRMEYKVKESFRCKYNIREKYGLPIDLSLDAYIDGVLSHYLTLHHEKIPEPSIISKGTTIPLTSFQLRVAFSCFIDADHTDTCLHFSNGHYAAEFSLLSPTSRIKKLDDYVGNLPQKGSDDKHVMRKRLYEVCKTDSLNKYFYELLDATVGNGKTLGAIRRALRLCEQFGHERIFSVAPFTNIINQTVDVYTKAILLDGETSHAINEIHSKVEFEEPKYRMYNNIWNAPVNVTTAVQFIESLVNPHTSSIRKLHLFCNSVIILDEFHTLMPYFQWDYVIDLFRGLAENYNSKFIFSSGSPVYYWDIFDKKIDVREILPKAEFDAMIASEKKRVVVVREKKPFTSVKKFSDFIFKKMRGNKNAMIVVNTIQNAIVLTGHFLALKKKGYRIFHLSSYLTPKDRAKILNEVKSSLSGKKKVILIATSIVECGMDISFDVGFRQNASLASVIQFDGRINRENLKDKAKTYLFDFGDGLLDDGTFTENPTFSAGKKVLESLPDDQMSPLFCTDAILKEMELHKDALVTSYFGKHEYFKMFRTIGKSFKVINANTVTIIVDPKLADDIRNLKYVSFRCIMRNSVQLWFTKLDDDRFAQHIEIVNANEKDYFIWKGPYHPVYGIGAPLLN